MLVQMLLIYFTLNKDLAKVKGEAPPNELIVYSKQ